MLLATDVSKQSYMLDKKLFGQSHFALSGTRALSALRFT